MNKQIFFASLLILLLSVSVYGQAFTLKTGFFFASLDSDLWEVNLENLVLAKNDFLSSTFGAEFEFSLNNHTALCIEMGTFTKTVFSQYRDYEYYNGSPILQNITLRITPIEFGAKLYPLGLRQIILPYLGASAGIYAWNYEQWGDFIDFQSPDLTISEGIAITRTYSPGFSLRGGISFRFLDNIGLIIEGKYQFLKGKLSGYFQDFEKLDLGGFQANIGVSFYLR